MVTRTGHLSIAGYLGIAAGGAAAVLIRWVRRRLAVVEVGGPSMTPALVSGDRVLIRRARFAELRVGLVAVVARPESGAESGAGSGAESGRGWAGPPPHWPPARGEWLIKRIAALPGDARPDSVPAPVPDSGDGLVPPGMFVVLGDNAAQSQDSRAIGCVPADRLLGIMIRPLGAAR